MLPKVTTEPEGEEKSQIQVIAFAVTSYSSAYVRRSCFKKELKYKGGRKKRTFLGLNNGKIRVELFDNIWPVFNGPLCHIALPLPEAKLEKKWDFELKKWK